MIITLSMYNNSGYNYYNYVLLSDPSSGHGVHIII